ncbi:Kazal-type serine protease inhibitor domain [Popillia japonica]|uniref:Kazal-type serine protease inhibitor domain n=1 Tax=Popillia japonica TaxID=7064 RepID=A0AAW1JYZ8_POPJA
MRFVFFAVLLALALTIHFTEAKPSRVRRQTNNVRDCIRNCKTTPQYNPICGSDNVTYDNEGKLNCAIDCSGQDIQVKFLGTCSPL